MENIINIINKLEESTKSTLSSLQNSYSPHYIDINYTIVDKVINYGVGKYYPNSTIIRLDNCDSIIIKRQPLDGNLLSAMENGIIKYFLFILDGKIYPLSMISIISDDRNTYLLINKNNIYNIRFFLFPFKIRYKENKYENPYDISFVSEIYNKYKNSIIIDLLGNCSVIKKTSINTSSMFKVETSDIKYRIFKNNILSIDSSKYNIIKFKDIEEYPINIFKINRQPDEPNIFYYYAFYNKNIIDKQVNFINQLLTNENLYNYLINNVDLQQYNFDFVFDKNLSYEDNINNITDYILSYDPTLFNSILSNKNIEKKYYTGSELLAIKDTNGYVNFSNYRNNSIENYVIIYVNNLLYDYHELIIRNSRGIRVKLINIKPEDKIEIVWYYGVDNKNYIANIPNYDYKYNGFSNYIKDNINTLEIFTKKLSNRVYDAIPESDSLLYVVEYYLSNNNKSINFFNDFYYNKDIVLSSKRQFRYMRLNASDKEAITSEINLTDDFKLCNNINQYMVFINNKFQSPNDYLFSINKYNNPINKRNIYLSSKLQIGDQIDIFYIPYPYKTIEFSEDYEIIDNGILHIDTNNYLGHPYNKNINDIFINSSKINDEYIHTTSSNIIKIMSSAIKYDKNIIILDYINEYISNEETIFKDYFINNDNIKNNLMVDILSNDISLISKLYNDLNDITITESNYRLYHYLKSMIAYHILLNFYIKLFNMIDASEYFDYPEDSPIVEISELTKHEYTSIEVDGSVGSEISYHEINYLENGQIEIKKTNKLGYSVIYLSDIDTYVENDIYSASIELLFDLKGPAHSNDINKLINIRHTYINGSIIDNIHMVYNEDGGTTESLMNLPLIFRACNINKDGNVKKVRFYTILYNQYDKIIITKPLSVENRPYPSDKIGIILIDPQIQTIEELPYNWEEYGII